MYYAMHICTIVKMEEEMFAYAVFMLWNEFKNKNVLLGIKLHVHQNQASFPHMLLHFSQIHSDFLFSLLGGT